MRTRARVDRNQREIVAALRRVGASVQSLASVGKGCPDLLIGWRGENWICEVKDGEARLTVAEWRWRDRWCGQAVVVRSALDALRMIGAMQ